jgi:hypothetical protein
MMKELSAGASLAGMLYEHYAFEALAGGFARGLVLMQAGEDKTLYSVPPGSEPYITVSPFIRSRQLASASRELDFDIAPSKTLDDYFWIPSN